MALIPELIEPSAYAIALSKEQCLSYCNYCIRRDVAELKKCAACRSLVYCSTDCQKKDWRQHKWECKAIKAKSAICDDGHRLVARLIALVNDGDFGEVQGSGKSAGAENRSILTLQEREGDPNGEAATFLREFREFFDGAGRIEEEKVEKMFKKVAINSFAVGNEFGSPIGIALCIKLSCVNHSCKPQTRVVFRNRAACLVPTNRRKPPKNFDTACHSYIDELQPIALRRKMLRQKYQFECNCEGCCDENRNSRMEAWNCGICVDGWMKNTQGANCELCGWDMTPDHYETCRLAEEATKNARITLQRDDVPLQTRNDLAEKLIYLMADTLHKYNVLRLPVLRLLYGAALFRQDLENCTKYGIELLDLQKQYQYKNDVAILYHKYGLAQVMIAGEAWESAQELLEDIHQPMSTIYGDEAQVVRNISEMLRRTQRD